MANYMAEVAKMLGVKIGEEFEICSNGECTVKLTEDGLEIVTMLGKLIDHANEVCLTRLITGKYNIKRKPWKPKVDERFYIVAINGEIMHKHWDDCSNHKNYYRLGNCYRTYAEAEVNRDKWLSFYASDEVLEV